MQTALITGASSGIGLELAKIFARNQTNLVLVARRGTQLKQLADELKNAHSVDVRVIAKDLSLPDAARDIYGQLKSDSVKIDVLVNNAGFGMFGKFAEADLDTQINMIQLNVAALTALTHLFVKDMVRSGGGKVLNLASTAAFQPGPLMAVYYASKAFVLSFSEAIANELEGTGVTVTALCPGPTESEFKEHANLENSRLFKMMKPMDAATVAGIGYRAMMDGKTVVVAGFRNKLLAESVRVSPRKLVTRMVRTMQERVRG